MLVLCECDQWQRQAGTTKSSVCMCYYSLCLCFLCPPGQRRHLYSWLISWCHRRREIIREETTMLQQQATQALSFTVRALPQTPFIEKQKLCFVCAGRQEVGCFHLVVWCPKKASSTWCLIIVVTGQDLRKHFNSPKTPWLNKNTIQTQTQLFLLISDVTFCCWCAFLPGLKGSDRMLLFKGLFWITKSDLYQPAVYAENVMCL